MRFSEMKILTKKEMFKLTSIFIPGTNLMVSYRIVFITEYYVLPTAFYHFYA